uniref:DUF1189 domain-containing protein n=1 Tax=Eisenbergiella sp. TaxID=1924109 RepID=UPI003AB33B9C
MSNMQNEEKKGFFSQIKTAVAKPSGYPSLSRLGGGRAAGFVFLFTFLYMLVILVIPYIFTMITSHGFQDYVTEYLPDFTISAGTLHMDDTFRYNSGDVYVYADSSTEYFEEDMVHILREEGYRKIALFARSNFIMYSDGSLQSSSYYGIGSFSREDILRFLPYLHLIMAIVAIVFYIFLFAGYFFSALIYGVLGIIVQSIMRITLPFGAIYKLALYSMVTPHLLKAVNSLLPFNIPRITWLCRLITCLYLVFGIKYCKDQFAAGQFTGQGGPWYGANPSGNVPYGNGYGNGNSYGNGNPYGGSAPYGNGNSYGNGNPSGGNAPYGNGNPYNGNAPYGKGTPYNGNVPYGNAPYSNGNPYGGNAPDSNGSSYGGNAPDSSGIPYGGNATHGNGNPWDNPQ